MSVNKQKTLLLVEDEALIALAEKRQMEKWGYKVITAMSGDDAVKIMSEADQGGLIDLILMDIDLGPGMNGPEAASEIFLKHKVPIVFLTFHSEYEMVNKVKGITRYGYVIKNSGDFVLQSSIEMAFELFEANQKLESELLKRKKVEDALRESEGRLQMAFENSGTVNSIFDTSCRLVLANSLSRENLADPEGKLIGKSVVDIFGYERGSEIESRMRRVMRTGKSEVFDSEFNFNSKKKWFRTVYQLLRKENGEVIGLQLISSEITEQKLAEEARQEMEQHYKTLAEEGQALIWVSGTDKECYYFNSAWFEFTGRKLEQEMGYGWSEGVHPDDLNRCISIYNIAFDARAKFSMEYRLRRHDGHYRWLLDEGCPRYDSNGNFTGYIGHCLDITELKESEEALRIRVEQFRILAAFVPVGIHLINQEGKCEYVNPAWSQMSGIYPENAQGDGWLNGVHPEDRQKVVENWEKMVKSKGKWGLEYRFMNNSGEVRWVYGLAAPQYNEKGEIIRYIGINTDITELRNTGLKLAETEERFSTMANLLPQIVFETDAEGRLVYVNRQAYSICGYSEKEDSMLGKSTIEFYVPEDRLRVVENIKRSIRGEAPAGGNEYKMYRKDGSVFPVLVFSNPIFKEGKPAGLRGIIIDITERKKAEDKINGLLKEKEIILKEVHHRIKNNMTTIKSLLDFHSGSLKNSEASNALSDASNRLESMIVLYDQLYKSACFSEIPIKEYLYELAVKVVNSFPDRTKVRIKNQLDDFSIGIRKVQPLGIITNELITNIMKYAFAGRDEGEITLSAVQSGTLVKIKISDNGVGIPEGFSFENSKGFGLMLVNILIKQLSGKIKFERGEGTAVCLEFEND